MFGLAVPLALSAVTLAGSIVAIPAPARSPAVAARSHALSPYRYAPGQPYLCRNPGQGAYPPTSQVKLPILVKVPVVRGTNDFNAADGNGYSLRTCYWKAVSGNVNYSCPRQPGSGRWKLTIAGFPEARKGEAPRAQQYLICNGRTYTVPFNFRVRSYVHVHLWAPREDATLRYFALSVR